MTSVGSSLLCRTSCSTTSGLAAARGRQPVSVLRLGRRVDEAFAVGEVHAYLDALRRRDVALGLDVLPRGVVALRADQREDVALATVLADQRRGQADPSPRLQVGCHPEDRSGQQVHLVVDHQPPVAGLEQLQMRVDAFATGRHHLVGRDRDRPDLLDRARVLADLVGGQGGTPHQLVLPLPRRDGVGDQDQRRRLSLGHRRRADHASCRPRRAARRRRSRRAQNDSTASCW